MSIGPFQILVIVLVLVLLFGRGRLSGVMGDVGKGVKDFRDGLEGDNALPPVGSVEGPALAEKTEAQRPDGSSRPG